MIVLSKQKLLVDLAVICTNLFNLPTIICHHWGHVLIFNFLSVSFFMINIAILSILKIPKIIFYMLNYKNFVISSLSNSGTALQGINTQRSLWLSLSALTFVFLLLHFLRSPCRYPVYVLFSELLFISSITIIQLYPLLLEKVTFWFIFNGNRVFVWPSLNSYVNMLVSLCILVSFSCKN